jgi:hypothetical protein
MRNAETRDRRAKDCDGKYGGGRGGAKGDNNGGRGSALKRTVRTREIITTKTLTINEATEI